MAAPKKQQEAIGSSYIGEIDLPSRHLHIENFNMVPKHAYGNNLITTIFKQKVQFLFTFAPEFRSLSWG